MFGTVRGLVRYQVWSTVCNVWYGTRFIRFGVRYAMFGTVRGLLRCAMFGVRCAMFAKKELVKRAYLWHQSRIITKIIDRIGPDSKICKKRDGIILLSFILRFKWGIFFTPSTPSHVIRKQRKPPSMVDNYRSGTKKSF